MSDTYQARLVEVHDQGVLLEPEHDTTIPDQPSDVNLLALGLVLALGAADYEHHPEPRNAAVQSLDALLAGETPMPWRAPRAGDSETADAHVSCERLSTGAWKCHIHAAPTSQAEQHK